MEKYGLGSHPSIHLHALNRSPRSRPCALVSMLCWQQLEWRALSMVRGLSEQLRSACSNVVSSAQGLPGTVQEQISNARQSAEELYSSMGSASSITPVVLERSRHHLAQVRTFIVMTPFFFVFVFSPGCKRICFFFFFLRCNTLWMASWTIC